MNTLITQIKQQVSISLEEERLILDSLEKKVLQKNDMLFTEGKISNYLYFINRGCIRMFYNVDGNEKTTFFYTDGQYISVSASYNFGEIAIENYQAIEETEVYLIHKSKVDDLLKKIPKLDIIYRVATEHELIAFQRLVASFVTLSPEERYTELLKTNKELYFRVPQQYIASYLGVSPETLSRIKARIVKKSRS